MAIEISVIIPMRSAAIRNTKNRLPIIVEPDIMAMIPITKEEKNNVFMDIPKASKTFSNFLYFS